MILDEKLLLEVREDEIGRQRICRREGSMRRSRRWLGMCAAVLAAAGCGSQSATVGLHGEVTYEGRAVETGRIDFIPAMYNDRSTLKVRIADMPDKNKAGFSLGKVPVALR